MSLNTLGPDTLLEEEDHQPERRRHREQVHHDRLRRDDQRPEGDGEQHERQRRARTGSRSGCRRWSAPGSRRCRRCRRRRAPRRAGRAKTSGTTSVRSSRTVSIAASAATSPVSGALTSATSPSSPSSTWTGPNDGSASSVACRSAMADVTGGVSSPSTTISTGDPSPPENSLSRTRKACLDSTSSGRVLTPENPSDMLRKGRAASSSTPAASTRLTTGRPMTVRAIRSQNRPCRSGCRRPRIRSHSTRSPSSASTAGSRVSEATTATTTTRMAPSPMLR